MTLVKQSLLTSALALVPLAALADEKTVTLSVDGMSCVSCPYQVQSALKRVDGVVSATASLKTNSATVVYDDDLTTLASLTEATTKAGFPSAPQED